MATKQTNQRLKAMAIVGLTNQNTSRGKIEISIFKGERKTENRPGQDLNKKVRISTANGIAQAIFRTDGRYGKQNKDGDFFTEQVHLYLPYATATECFPSAMKAFDASGLKLVCDKHTISSRLEIIDVDGDKWRQIREVKEECPLRAQTNVWKCPNGCTKNGELLFFERFTFDNDLMLWGRITTHGFEDIGRLSQKLQYWQEFFGGNLSRSPFPSPMTRHKIPYILQRTEVDILRPVLTGKEQGYKRTEKKAQGKTWALDIYPDPEWMKFYSLWQQWQAAQTMKNKLPKGAIAQLVGRDDLIEAEVVQTQVQSLPASGDARSLLYKVINELRLNLGISKEDLRQICLGEFGKASATEMDVEQLIQLRNKLQVLCDQEAETSTDIDF